MKQLKIDIKNGREIEDSFQSFIARGGDPLKGSWYLAGLPSKSKKKEYSTLNTVLWVSYLVFVLVGLLSILPTLQSIPREHVFTILGFALIIPVLLIYSIARMHVAGYYFMVLFSVRSLLQADFTGQSSLVVAFSVCVPIMFAVASVFLKIKVYPHQNIVGTKKGSNGWHQFSTT